MAFNPEKHKPAKDQSQGYDDREVPPGTYLTGITWWKRVSERSVKFRFVVLAGPLKGASFFALIPTNVEEKQASADRMFFFCKAFAITGDLDFTDRCIAEDFLGTAGKVKVTVKRNGQYKDHDIRQFVERSGLSQAERDLVVSWVTEYAEKRQSYGSDQGAADGGSWDPDEYSDFGSKGGGSAAAAPAGDPFGDDDIPF